MRLPYRLGFWLAGAGSLGLSAYLWIGNGPTSLGALIIQQFVAGDPSISSALDSDWSTVVGAQHETFSGVLVIAAALGLLALLALTPGDRLEKAIRPVKVGLIGFIGGFFFALVAVAIGVAGYYKHKTYMGVLTAEDVHDGDTIKFGDVSIRLSGIDAPELDQRCASDLDCGLDAGRRLANLVNGRLVVCAARDETVPRESFGRPLMRCTVRLESEEIDLARFMIAEGLALPYATSSKHPSPYEGDANWSAKFGCALKPWVWRNDRDKRQQFLNRDYEAVSSDLIGDCRA